MRKLSARAVVLVVAVVAGCGGGGDGGGADASSSLDNALRYLPADVPFAAAIETDTSSEQFEAAREIADRFPFGDDVEERIRGALDMSEDGFERFQEVLGNELVVGSTDVDAFVSLPSGEGTRFVGAIQAPSQALLDDMVRREGVEEDGEASGATIYRDGSGDPFAVEGDVLVVAGTREGLEAALERRDGDDGMTEEDFEAGIGDVSRDALLRVYLDVGALLRASDAAKEALRVEWVRAVRTGGIALAFEGEGIAIEVDVTTDPVGLTEADLPIATGGADPQVLARDDVELALRDPAHVLEFAQRTAGVVDPSGFGAFEAGLAQIERGLGIDVQRDLLGQLEGDLALTIDRGKFGARAQLEDPAAFERTLGKLADILPELAEGATGEKVGFARPKPGEDFYAIATADGDRVVFGVVDGVFVLANDPAIAGSLAADRTAAVPGARGALVIDGSADEIVRAILSRIEGTASELVEQVRAAIGAGPLDQLTGSIEASPAGLSGRFRLTLDE